MSAWQPIETAPDIEPGRTRPILIWHETFGWSIARSRYGQHGIGSATHWQPLPEPPVQS